MSGRIPPKLLLLLIAATLVVACVQPARAWHNRGGLAALQALTDPADVAALRTAQRALQTAAGRGRPEAFWTLGMLATHVGDETVRQAAQARLLDLTPARLELLRVAAPDDRTLAAAALDRYPTRTSSLAWRAAQLIDEDPARAIALYQQALAQNPIPYDWWLGLGHAYEQAGDDYAALAAYTMGCDLAVGVIPCHELTALRTRLQNH